MHGAADLVIRGSPMDALLLLFGCLLLVILVAGPVLAIIALVRTSRIAGLEREVRRLSRRLAEGPAGPESRPPPPAAAPAPVAPPARPPVSPSPAAPAPRTPQEKGAFPSAPRLRDIEWERWIGVRGAAVLGGVIAALAAVLFFQHAITSGWITPPMRVALGATAGAVLLGLGNLLRRRGFAWAPDALEGAGIVALYATAWAADKRYGMIGLAASFPLMAAITALACLLALRHRSLVAAVIGLLGGFATPLLLSSGSDRPFSLFGYVLLLDLGLVFVGRRRRWPSIGALALVGTFVIESVWIFPRMGPDRLWLGLVILGVFAVLFAVSGGFVPAAERRRWLPTQAGAMLFPFVFALYFAGHVEMRGPLWPTALLLGLLTAGAFVVGRGQGVPWLPVGGASACVAVVGVWLFSTDLAEAGRAWELAAVAAGLALLPHLGGEWERRRASEGGDARGSFANAAAGAMGGWMLLAVFACGRGEGVSPWPLLALLAVLAALLARQAWITGLDHLIHAAALGPALGLAVLRHAHLVGTSPVEDGPVLDPRAYAALLVAAGLVLLAGGHLARGGRGRAFLHGVGIFLAVHILDFASAAAYHDHDPWLLPLTALGCGALLAVAGTRLRRSPMFVVAVVGPCFLTLRWSLGLDGQGGSPGARAGALALVLALATLLTAWPTVFRRRFAGLAASWRLGGLAAPLLLLPTGVLFEGRFGDALPLGPPLLLGLVSLGALAPLALRARAGELATWRIPLAWYGGACLFLLALTAPVQVGVYGGILAGALWAAGLAWLARRLAHAGVAWLSVLVIAAVTLMLLGLDLENDRYARAALPLVNWIGYTNLVPAAAAVAVVLSVRDVPEGLRLPRAVHAARRVIPGICALVIVFLWLNLEILNHFAAGERLTHDVPRLPARDVTMSIAWGVYALVLLVLGTVRRASALRWSSLALFILAIGKVFLLDLGHLDGLWRVASLAGLAVSLIVVSLLYQRFVFRPQAPRRP